MTNGMAANFSRSVSEAATLNGVAFEDPEVEAMLAKVSLH